MERGGQCHVALRKESVDRNLCVQNGALAGVVALRKESVDRNILTCFHTKRGRRSLSARRAWIEMVGALDFAAQHLVALRKESVDRNTLLILHIIAVTGRSPQGERG